MCVSFFFAKQVTPRTKEAQQLQLGETAWIEDTGDGGHEFGRFALNDIFGLNMIWQHRCGWSFCAFG